MRVALVHDWMVGFTGGEKVVSNILQIFPQADVYTLVDFLPKNDREFLNGHLIYTSFLQKIPFAQKRYRNFIFLMPLIIEKFDFRDYELVISSSAAISKGVITGPDTLHVAYIHSPPRYAWDLQGQYLAETNLTKGVKGIIARLILHYLRLWDFQAGQRPDYLIANSRFIQRRIMKVYRRESKVIYPPVDVNYFTLVEDKNDYFLTVSRMVPYKKVNLIVEAFRSLPNKQLIVIGDGPDFPKIQALAGPNVTLLGYQPPDVLKKYLQKARAFVYAAEEDFGIAVVEAMACGTPVIAYNKGGTGETVVNGENGILFSSQSVENIVSAIHDFEEIPFDPRKIREFAQQFSNERFITEFKGYIDSRFLTT
jgi:glycosyltransferase involved in cell wall biosynthesis